jgi:hypothetical protein
MHAETRAIPAYAPPLSTRSRRAAGESGRKVINGLGAREALSPLLIGNCNWIIPWRGFPGKGQTKSKAPVRRYGGLGITV